MKQAGWRLGCKRALDVGLAVAGLGVSAPVLAVAALGVRARLGAPVLFRQTRAGRGGVPFTLYKLRTMREAVDASGRPLPDDARLGRLGRALRASSLDELPQLWNVLRGDMSLVGPRPLLMEYLPRYSPRQARRHEALPGLTGWAQVQGRNALPWEERLALDVDYVERWSLRFDLKILLETVPAVLARRGLSAPGHATCPEFQGSP